ncbi:hypothetical protein, partial [Escherichia coli]
RQMCIRDRYQRLWQHYQQAQHWVPGGTQEEVMENERQ